MLGVSAYPRDYIDSCRAGVRAQISAYEALTALAGDGDARLAGAIGAFEPLFLNHMVLALDAYFCHRLRGKEGKDGNPLNEVRVLCASIMSNDGILVADKTIKLTPESSVLGYAAGDEIKLDASGFSKLAEGFFAEIERKYPEAAPVGS